MSDEPTPELGKMNRLMVIRESDHGLYLNGGLEIGDILLPTREVPEDVEPGDEIDIFLSRDSEDRIVATTSRPIVQAGEFASLQVVSMNDRIGAFLDWGMAKDLLLPHKEQTTRVREGDRVVVYVMVDERSNRLVATMKTNRFLNQTPPSYSGGEPVTMLIYEESPLGFNAVVDGKYRGLLHNNHIHRPIKVGDALEGYVAELREHDKLDLSLEPVGYSRITGLAGRILEALDNGSGKLPLNDKSSPDRIKLAFGVSKKAFKAAIGGLYRQKRIRFTEDGIELISR